MKPTKNRLSIDSSFLLVCNDILFNADANELPIEIDAMVEGKHGKKKLLNGKIKDVVITASDIDAVVDFVHRRRTLEPNREFVIDYEHQTLSGAIAPAAGWYKDLKVIVREGVKVARAVISKWTPGAGTMIANGEYRYVSPVFIHNYFDDVTQQLEQCALFNMGLTNEPFLKNMMPLVAASEFFSKQSQSIIGKDTHMEDLLRWLVSFLNLPTASTAEDVLAELGKLSDKIKAAIESGTVTAKTVLDYLEQNKPSAVIAGKNSLNFQTQVIAKLGLEANASPEQTLALLVTAKSNADRLAGVTTELETLKTNKLNQDFDLVIAKGFQRGAILPVQKNDAEWMKAQKAWAEKDFAKFETYFCTGAPVVGPVVALPNNETASKSNGLSDLDKEVARLSGVDAAIVAKHNPVTEE